MQLRVIEWYMLKHAGGTGMHKQIGENILRALSVRIPDGETPAVFLR